MGPWGQATEATFLLRSGQVYYLQTNATSLEFRLGPPEFQAAQWRPGQRPGCLDGEPETGLGS